MKIGSGGARGNDFRIRKRCFLSSGLLLAIVMALSSQAGGAAASVAVHFEATSPSWGDTLTDFSTVLPEIPATNMFVPGVPLTRCTAMRIDGTPMPCGGVTFWEESERLAFGETSAGMFGGYDIILISQPILPTGASGVNYYVFWFPDGTFRQRGTFNSIDYYENGRMGARLTLASVPEPNVWMMLIGGLGVVGAYVRRARTQVRSN